MNNNINNNNKKLFLHFKNTIFSNQTLVYYFNFFSKRLNIETFHDTQMNNYNSRLEDREASSSQLGSRSAEQVRLDLDRQQPSVARLVKVPDTNKRYESSSSQDTSLIKFVIYSIFGILTLALLFVILGIVIAIFVNRKLI
jgi:hypothetical protein